MSSRRRWVIRILPWLVAAAVLIFLFSHYSVADIAAEMGRGNALGLLLPMAVMMVVSLALVALADWVVLGQTVDRPPRVWGVLRARAATTLLMAFSYFASGGGLAVWISRKTGARVSQAVGLLFYIMVSELTALAIIAAVALWVGGGELLAEQARSLLGWAVPVVVVGVVVIALLLPRILTRLLPDPQFMRAAARVPPWAFGANLGLRTMHLANVCFCKVWAASSFGLDIPVGELWTYMPVILLVGALPVNVLGIGALQVVWLIFEPWASAESILAFVFLWQLLFLLALVLRGLPFLSRVMAEIADGRVKASASGGDESAPGRAPE